MTVCILERTIPWLSGFERDTVYRNKYIQNVTYIGVEYILSKSLPLRLA